MDNHFDTEIAESYDDPAPTPEARAELDASVALLHALASGGPALEFAIGTGRVALPLAASGTPVAGIEYSPAMLAVLRRKPGTDALTLVAGDMATATVPGQFALVFLVYNTIGNLTSQAAQVACFENAARHLAPGGRFVIENMIPPLRRFPPGAPGVPFALTATHTGIDEIDTATQAMTSHHYTKAPDGTLRHHATPQRYTWPAELDLMARIAGLTLEHRWGGWDKRPFDAESDKHVSVWRKP